MKKIFSFIVAFVMMITLANAQTVESSRLFENTYVTVFGGATTTGQPALSPFFWDGVKNVGNSLRPLAGVEFGKYFTPVVGVSVEGQGLFSMHDKVVAEGEEAAKQLGLDQTAVFANGKINFSNWFGGYKGQPRRVEVVGVAGAGWGYNFDEAADVRHSTVYKAGAELNVNMGQARAWQFTVRPAVVWNNTSAAYPKLSVNDMNVQVTAGFVYKFGSKKRGHNFRLCPYSVTQADYDAVVAERDALRNRPAEVKEVVKTVTETKEVMIKGDTRVLVGSTIITFPIGSVELSTVERQKVEMFAKSLDSDTLVQVVGSADTKTGTETRNFALAQNRANIVKTVLMQNGVSEDRITVNTKMDATDNVETSRSAILTLSVE